MLKELIADFATWLYKKYVTPDLRPIILEQLKLVYKQPDFGKLNKNQQLQVMSECYRIVNMDKAFKFLFDTYVEKQKEITFNESSSQLQINCGRSAVFAICALRKQFEVYAAQYESLKEDKSAEDISEVI